jgi:hypothetical protein
VLAIESRALKAQDPRLKALKTAGVPDAVILAMVRAS